MRTVNDTKRPAGADRPIPELLQDLTEELKALVRDELALVRLEVTRKGKEAGASAGFFGATTLLGLGAFIAFTIMLIGLLSLGMHVWVAGLIVTVLYGAGAAISAKFGKERLDKAASLPNSAASNVMRDVDAVRAGVERGR